MGISRTEPSSVIIETMNFDILVYDEFHVVVFQHLSVLFNKKVHMVHIVN